MSADVEERLKDHAARLADGIWKEYQEQITKWTAYLNLVADQQIAAKDSFQATLQDIKRKAEEAEQFAMMALSLIGMAACTWIGALVELELYPRVAGKVVLSDGFKEGKYWVKSREEYSEFAAKFFGDEIKELLGHPLDKLFELVMPEAGSSNAKINDAFWNSILGSNLGSFRTNIVNGLAAASQDVMDQLRTLSTNIDDKQDFGKAVLREVDKRFPRSKSRSQEAADDLLERNGRTLLDDYFYKLRQRYAKDWFYYGNDPVTSRLPLLAFHFEVQIWALWILNQDWKMKYAAFGGEDTPATAYWISGDFGLDEIMGALEELAGKDIWTRALIPDEGVITSSLLDAGKREDEDKDMAKVLAWAKTTPGKILHANLDYRPRSLGTS
jgi:hypothetical protein